MNPLEFYLLCLLLLDKNKFTITLECQSKRSGSEIIEELLHERINDLIILSARVDAL